MYANAVIDCHEEFDIEEFARQFFDTSKQCLIVKEKATKWHWHIHGVWIGDRKAYKEVPHPDRHGEGRQKTRPVRVAFDKDGEKGFRYSCKGVEKGTLPDVVRQWHISDLQIREWHDKWHEGKSDTKAALKRAMSEVLPGPDPEKYSRDLKRCCYDFQTQAGKLINPPHVRQHVLTYMYQHECSFNRVYQEWVLKQ